MSQASTALAQAREAWRRRDWTSARDAYLEAGAELDLTAEDRYALARCCWILGDVVGCEHHLEQAHHRSLDEGAHETAAFAALHLGIGYLMRGDEPLGSGWLGRAVRLAEALPEGTVHGYLALVVDLDPHGSDTAPEAMLDAGRRVQQLGRRFDDPTLVAGGLNGQGRALIRAGELSAGVRLLDEAMVAVLAGEVHDVWAGAQYCTTITTCHDVGDLRRMARWTEAFERWLESLPDGTPLGGDCRLHRAQLFTLRGDWDRAEQEAARACEQLADTSVGDAAQAWYEVGEVRRRRGELGAAEEAYAAAHRLGLDPQPGLALLRLVQGRTGDAASAIRAALLAAGEDRVRRGGLCAAQVEIALAADDLDTARRAADELDRLAVSDAGPDLRATAARARGAVLHAEGHPEEALPPLREACAAWHELEVPYEVARTGVLLARAYAALGDHDAAARELAAAAPVFDRLGAHLDAAGVAGLRGGVPRPGGLSDRELDVLRLVADGRSNPQIAEALYISRKTVARHMSNIFTKLGVSSRTEAARFALDHRLLQDRPG